MRSLLLPAISKVVGGHVLVRVGNNFLALTEVRLTPNLARHTLGHSGRGD